jgi:hypothetical protein
MGDRVVSTCRGPVSNRETGVQHREELTQASEALNLLPGRVEPGSYWWRDPEPLDYNAGAPRRRERKK